MPMWNSDMNQVIISRNMIWLKCMFYAASKIAEPFKLEDDAHADDAVDED